MNDESTNVLKADEEKSEGESKRISRFLAEDDLALEEAEHMSESCFELL